jgi:RNA polymerase sigma-70 factor, ECF subfamily
LPDDLETSKRIARGDAGAFEEFYVANQPRLVAFLRQLVGSLQAAEGVAQDTFAQIWRRPDGFRPERGTLRAYLYGIGKRQAAEWWRKHMPCKPEMDTETEGLM